MQRKKREVVIIAGVGLFAILIVLFFLPIKFAINLDDFTKDKGEYYICEQQSVTGPNWRIIGNNSGSFDESDYVSVIIEGVDPQNILNESLQIDSPNRYVVYGAIESEGDFHGETFPVITSSSFDMVYPIERGASLRFFVPNNYLTLLDYKWIR
jgi:hypothetical protein